MARFPNFISLIDEAIKDLIADVKTFESHDYIIKYDKIAYKVQEGISFNIRYGQKTLFGYFLEHSRGKISQKSKEQNTNIVFGCGKFSYGELPYKFSFILGVTGTLSTLNQSQLDIVEKEYKILRLAFIPSIQGDSRLSFGRDSDILLVQSREGEAGYFNAIVNEMQLRLICKNSVNLAVLVFFESKEILNKFLISPQMGNLKNKVNVITEETPIDIKEMYIKMATTSGQITLLTRLCLFGRGTDFICYDNQVNSNGGVQVLQTFLSDELSEETLIKGRTARQGECGLYRMILFEPGLEKQLLSKTIENDTKTARSTGNLYNLLNEKRNFYFEQNQKSDHKHGEEIKLKNDQSEKFVEQLLSGNPAEFKNIMNFLLQENLGNDPKQIVSRTFCIMDATGSMDRCIKQAKNTVGSMYERVSKILESELILSKGIFEMQFVVYRNYDALEDKLLEFSP